MNTDLEEQEDELLALQSIFDSEEFVREESKFAGEIRVSVVLPTDFSVVLKEGETLRQYDISFLPPLLLTFDLPEGYPSSAPPSFTLICSWLTNTQLAALSAKLIDLYQATGDAVVLFSWMQFLKEDALRFLDIHSLLELPSDGHSALRDIQNATLSELKSNLHTPAPDGQCCDASNPFKLDISAKCLEVEQNPSASGRGNIDFQGASMLDSCKTDQNNPTMSSEPNTDYQTTLSSEAAVQNQTTKASDVMEAEQSFQAGESNNLFIQSDLIDQEDFLNEGYGFASLLPASSSASLGPSAQEAASLLVHPRDSPQNEDQTLSGLSLTPSQTLLSQILIYDAAQKQKVFDSTVFDCGVCFVGWLGLKCVQLSECGHVFCQACLGEFCKVQITEGNVRGVSCPQVDCTATPTPAQVKSLVGEELFSRYDRLLLQSTLDCMTDVAYCPRYSCGAAVILDKSSTAAMCSVCNFAFCITCRKTYHGTDDCQANVADQIDFNAHVGLPHSQDVAYCPRRSCSSAVILKKFSTKALCSVCGYDFCVICRKAYHGTDKCQAAKKVKNPNAPEYLPESQKGMRALWNEYVSGTKHTKRLLESKYGRKLLMFILESGLSDLWISSNSKSCPHCFCKIQKEGGCNMMTCFRCKQMFCWKCLTRLPPRKSVYAHFKLGRCPLYQS